MLKAAACITLLGALGLVSATNPYEDLKKVEHVILFMQENRAFDHYFGTLKGVRGFQDPNAQINDGKPVFYQKVNASISNATDYLLPFHLSYQGETGRAEGVQCLTAGSNAYAPNEEAYNDGKNDMWAIMNSPLSVGYFKRSDIPVQYALADAFGVGDMYQEATITATDPNRIMLWSGSINVPGNDRFNSTRGPAVDNSDSPGCHSMSYSTGYGLKVTTAKNYSCYPYDWKTVPEYLEESNISWQIYQALENFGDNPLILFEQYQNLSTSNPENPLIQKGLLYQPYGSDKDTQLVETWPAEKSPWTGGIDAFIADVQNGTLPEVSYIVLPSELSEHPPNTPNAGAWAQKLITDTLMNSTLFKSSVMLISYDETGGWSDHVTPFTPPAGTVGEWMWNPFVGKDQPTGPGFRLPFTIVSPWTHDGVVFTEPSDHISQILFLERWAEAHGKPFFTQAITEWRRKHMSDLVNAFDFSHTDTSFVVLPDVDTPVVTNGFLDSTGYCEDTYANLIKPTVPYGNQTAKIELAVEVGFRPVRGQITEGRHLIFETNGYALALHKSHSHSRKSFDILSAKRAVSNKEEHVEQRIVIHAEDPKLATSSLFRISFPAANSKTQFLSSSLEFVDKSSSAVFSITYVNYKVGYVVQDATSGKYLVIKDGKPKFSHSYEGFKFYSVTF